MHVGVGDGVGLSFVNATHMVVPETRLAQSKPGLNESKFWTEIWNTVTRLEQESDGNKV